MRLDYLILSNLSLMIGLFSLEFCYLRTYGHLSSYDWIV